MFSSLSSHTLQVTTQSNSQNGPSSSPGKSPRKQIISNESLRLKPEHLFHEKNDSTPPSPRWQTKRFGLNLIPFSKGPQDPQLETAEKVSKIQGNSFPSQQTTTLHHS